MKKSSPPVLTKTEQANLEHSPLDAALDCCQNIETLAQLLQRTAPGANADMVDALLVSNSGYLIAREVEHLRRVLHRMDGAKANVGASRAGRD